jgi:hypothetical protein
MANERRVQWSVRISQRKQRNPLVLHCLISKHYQNSASEESNCSKDHQENKQSKKKASDTRLTGERLFTILLELKWKESESSREACTLGNITRPRAASHSKTYSPNPLSIGNRTIKLPETDSDMVCTYLNSASMSDTSGTSLLSISLAVTSLIVSEMNLVEAVAS